ncbi:MAG: c-type cytochrome [Rhodocyclales bacterium]|nr:c-type cytochrome [Rhodocyclales bacterium]
MKLDFRFSQAATSALLLVLAAPVSLAADAPQSGASIDAGAIYLRVCSACHGEKGDANSLAQGALAKRPRNFTAPEARLRLNREYMIAIVRDGRPHTPMTGRASRLSQQEIEAVVDYIRARFMSAAPDSAPAARGS